MAIILFCLADIYVHSIKHYAELEKKIFGCILFILALGILVACIIPPTLFINDYVACPTIPASAIAIEYAILSFSYIYVLIHVVLFVYHCNLRTQLANMNIDDVIPPLLINPVDAQSHDRSLHSPAAVHDRLSPQLAFGDPGQGVDSTVQ